MSANKVIIGIAAGAAAIIGGLLLFSRKPARKLP